MSYMAVFATEREIQNGWGFCGDNMFPKFALPAQRGFGKMGA